MNLPVMLPPPAPSTRIDGGARTVGVGFAARLLASLDPSVDAGTPAPALAAPAEGNGGDAPSPAQFASLMMPPALAVTALEVEPPVPADDVAAGSTDEDPETVDSDLQAPVGSGAGSAAPVTSGLLLTGAQAAAADAVPTTAADGAPVEGDKTPVAVPAEQPTPRTAGSAGHLHGMAPDGATPAAPAAHADVTPAAAPDTDVPTVPVGYADAPVAGAAVAGAAVADASATDALVADAPVADASVEDASVTGAAVTDALVADAPVADAAITEASAHAGRTPGPATDSDAQPTTPATAGGAAAVQGRRPNGPPNAAPAAPDETAAVEVAQELAPASTGPAISPSERANAADQGGMKHPGTPSTSAADPSAGVDGDGATPTVHSAATPGRSGDTSAPAAPALARIVDLVERLRAEPPPQQVVIDLDQFGVGKLVVSLRGDTVVVESLDPSERLDPQWQDELGAALDEHGWSFESEGQSREGRQQPRSPAPDLPAADHLPHAARAADGHLRL